MPHRVIARDQGALPGYPTLMTAAGFVAVSLDADGFAPTLEPLGTPDPVQLAHVLAEPKVVMGLEWGERQVDLFLFAFDRLLCDAASGSLPTFSTTERGQLTTVSSGLVAEGRFKIARALGRDRVVLQLRCGLSLAPQLRVALTRFGGHPRRGDNAKRSQSRSGQTKEAEASGVHGGVQG
jgi:hypothetical protein